MACPDILLEEDDGINENLLLLNLYQGNLQFLKQVPLHKIPDGLKFEAAALYFGTSQYENEWKGVLEDLGVNYITLYGIDYKSSKTGNLPIYLALNGVLQSNTSFGDFVDVLCKREKFHILRHLKPFVEGLLSKRYSYSEDTNSRPKPSAPDFSSLEVTTTLVDSFDSGDSCSTHQDTGCDSATSRGIKEKQTNDHKIAQEHFQNSEVVSFVNSTQLPSDINQSGKKISVFIMHSMVDKKYAKKLATHLKEKNFYVVTSANIYKFLRENPSMIMKAVDELVDFVIPVISESFMKQIKFSGSYVSEEDLESVANTFMYDRLLNEYCRSNFFNHRVKPVCYSLETRKIEKIDQILSWSSYLPFTDLKNVDLLESELLRHLRCK